jgi:putative two-component system response regulator
VRPIIRCHHERLDGSGYPQGLKGDDVPLLAQIVGIADVYDALTSHRPYRPALSPDQAARHVLQEAAQGKFARDHVETFLNIAEVAVLPTV